MRATHILTGLKRRTPNALGAFYDDCGGILYGLILRIVGNSGAAEIIFELTFGEIWNHSYKQVRTDGELRTLTLLLGRRNALEYRQLQANSPTQDAEHSWPLAETIGRRATPNIVDGMNAVLNQLRAEDRELFDAVYFGGRSLSEIALRTSVPREELGNRIAGIFRMLRGATQNNRRHGSCQPEPHRRFAAARPLTRERSTATSSRATLLTRFQAAAASRNGTDNPPYR